MAGAMRYRLRVAAPDSANMTAFTDALRTVQGISDNRGYSFVAGLHGAPFWYCWHHQFSRRSDNRAQLFLPWHRAYMMYLDLALNDFDDEGQIAAPWWDWTHTPDVPEAYSNVDFDGQPNPLRRYRMNIDTSNGPINRFTTRSAGSNPFIRLPTAQQVTALLDDDDWSSFSDGLENIHDSVHGWVGGDMGSVTTAAYDPIFYAHHCMIDRIWYLWQIRHGINTISTDLLDVVLDPFSVRVGDVLDTKALGYEYADEVAPVEPVAPDVIV